MANGGGFWDDVDEYIECVIELCGFMLLVFVRLCIRLIQGILYLIGFMILMALTLGIVVFLWIGIRWLWAWLGGLWRACGFACACGRAILAR